MTKMLLLQQAAFSFKATLVNPFLKNVKRQSHLDSSQRHFFIVYLTCDDAQSVYIPEAKGQAEVITVHSSSLYQKYNSAQVLPKGSRSKTDRAL